MDKKTLYLSILGLVIVLVGCVVVWLVDFPAGIFVVLPSGIPHCVNLYRWKKEHQ